MSLASGRSKLRVSSEESGGFPGAKSDFPPSKVKVPVSAVFDDNRPACRLFEKPLQNSLRTAFDSLEKPEKNLVIHSFIRTFVPKIRNL